MSESSLRKLALTALAFAVLGTVTGCYRGPRSEVGPAVVDGLVELGHADYSSFTPETYQLRPNDVINVSVFREADMSLNGIPVSASGEVSFPLLGPMQVAGLTTSQLESQLESMLDARFLRYPNVTVNVVQYASHVVTVEGSVASPGLYNFRPGTRLSGALALASGPSRVARRSDVAVFREVPDGIVIAKFDYLAMQSGTMIDPVLEPGDRVVVGLNSLSQLYQDVLSVLPMALWIRWIF